MGRRGNVLLTSLRISPSTPVVSKESFPNLSCRHSRYIASKRLRNQVSCVPRREAWLGGAGVSSAPTAFALRVSVATASKSTREDQYRNRRPGDKPYWRRQALRVAGNAHVK